MNYDDFPLLKNNDYEILSQHYSELKQDKKTIIYLICSELICCANSCPSISNSLNHKSQIALNESRHLFEKLANNLTNLFNLSIENKTMKEINLFSFMKKTTSILQNFLKWANQENKEYYKKHALQAANELAQQLNLLLSCLENSNIFMFKYM